jgi:WD40 repeat protein
MPVFRLVPGMLFTCSIDKTVALWDTQHAAPTPQSCGSKHMNVGKLYSVSCYPSSPWLIACGGSGQELAIWDMEEEDAIQNRFASRISGSGTVSNRKDDDSNEPNFEAMMAAGDDSATKKALEGMNKSKTKKKGKKKAHKKA